MITYNIPILASQEEFDKIVEILEMERYVWNESSKHIFKTGKRDIKLVHAATYHKIRKEKPEIPSQVILRGTRSARSAYKSAKSNKHCIDVPCEKKNLSIRLDKRIYKWNGRKIQITVADSRKRVEVELQLFSKTKELFDKYETSDPLIFLRKGRLFLAVTFKTEAPNVIDNSNCVGIDMGIKNILSVSDGRIYSSKQLLKRKREVKFLNNKLYSKKTKSSRRHARKRGKKERNFSKNFCHKLANEFLKETVSKTLVFEDLKDLKLSTAKKNKKKGKLGNFINSKVASVPISLLREIITYKSKRLGFSIVLVDPAFTSQIDFRTGKCSGKRHKGAYYTHDNKVLHSDLNASCNIAQRAKIPHFLSQRKLTDVIKGQGTVNCPIAL